MTIRTPDEAVAAALAQHTNDPETCQGTTRGWYLAPSAGDVDHDGDADAVDGWLSEPLHARHTDRKPWHGAPCAWSGGTNGNGHRALAMHMPDGTIDIRSTDAGGRGITATVPLDYPERVWGLHWLGYSDTIDGQIIPPNAPPVVPKPPRHRSLVDRIRRLLNIAKTRGKPGRRASIKDAINDLPGH